MRRTWRELSEALINDEEPTTLPEPRTKQITSMFLVEYQQPQLQGLLHGLYSSELSLIIL